MSDTASGRQSRLFPRRCLTPHLPLTSAPEGSTVLLRVRVFDGWKDLDGAVAAALLLLDRAEEVVGCAAVTRIGGGRGRGRGRRLGRRRRRACPRAARWRGRHRAVCEAAHVAPTRELLGVVRLVQARDLHHVARVRSVQELVIPDVDALVVDVAGRVLEEDDVARLQLVDSRDVHPLLELVGGHAPEVDPGLVVAPLHETRAVEPGLRVVPAPQVRSALEASRRPRGRGAPRARRRRPPRPRARRPRRPDRPRRRPRVPVPPARAAGRPGRDESRSARGTRPPAARRRRPSRPTCSCPARSSCRPERSAPGAPRARGR